MTNEELWNFGICSCCENHEWLYMGGTASSLQGGYVEFNYICPNCLGEIKINEFFKNHLTIDEYKKLKLKEKRLNKLNKIYENCNC